MNIEKVAKAAQSYKWSMADLDKLFYVAQEGSFLYQCQQGQQVRFKIGEDRRLCLLQVAYNDEEVYLQFHGIYGENPGKSLCILATIKPDWKPGDKFNLPELI